MISAALWFGSVVVVCLAGLQALRMALDFKARSFENRPVAELAAKLDALESRLLSSAMRR